LVVAAPVTLSNFELAGGTLDGAGALTVPGTLEWTAGTMMGGGLTVIPMGAVFNLSGASSKALRRSVMNAGTATWSGVGNINGGDGAVFTNQAGMTLTIQNDQVWTHSFGMVAPQLVNQPGAVLRKMNSNATTTFSGVVFTNAGTVNAESGTLAFNGGYNQSAGATHLAGGHLSTSTTINIQGGVLDGTGNIGGNVVNAGHVNPGLSPGRITHSGNYTQLGAGALNVEINGPTAGTEHDRIDLVGMTTLAGALNVSFGFAPQAGSAFTIIDNNLVDAVTGTFTGKPEGAMFDSGGAQLQISYVGGDGNDVVLSVAGGQPATSTPTLTSSVTATASASPSTTATSAATATPSATAVATATGSPAASATASATRSATPTATVTITGAATATPSGTLTASATASDTATSTATGAATATDTASPTVSPTASPGDTEPPTPTPTATLGLINLSGVVFRPGPQGLVGVGDALVQVYVCPRRQGCLGSAGAPAASAITSRSGEFRMAIPVNTSVSNTFYFRVSLNGVPFRALIVRSPLPNALAGVAPPDVVLDPISEAATRLLEEIGAENVDDEGLAAINEAVRAANAATVFDGLSDEAAADLATTTAANDPAVQEVLEERTTPTPTPPCPGDCDGRGSVTVDELIRGVNIALGIQGVEACPAFDRDASDTVSIAELILAVNAALSGCR
jgi:hypothetical protein